MAKLIAFSALATASASSCTGTTDPVVTGDTCYQGAAGALGLKETVLVNIHTFTSPTATLDISGSGIESFTCAGKSATKSGQDINVDFGTDGCLPNHIEVTAVKYCSDQDTIKVTVKDDSVPIPITATLSKTDCSSSSSEPSMFEDFQFNFGKVYNGEEETTTREKIFNDNVKIIVDTNRAQSDYTLAVNMFADLTKEEFAAAYLKRAKPEETEPVLSVHEWEGETLASSVDWVQKGAVTPIKNQGQCGGCWAYAACAALEGANFVSNHELVSLSEQEFLKCDTNDSGCNGGLEYQGWQYFMDKNQPICTEDGFSGNCNDPCTKVGIPAGGITGIKHVSKSASSLMSALNQQPVSVGIEADQSSFQLYNGGILSGSCGTQLDHSVLAVGYASDSYWKIKNSWGASWGENGYIRIAMGSDKCGILDDASYPTVGASAVTV